MFFVVWLALPVLSEGFYCNHECLTLWDGSVTRLEKFRNSVICNEIGQCFIGKDGLGIISCNSNHSNPVGIGNLTDQLYITSSAWFLSDYPEGECDHVDAENCSFQEVRREYSQTFLWGMQEEIWLLKETVGPNPAISLPNASLIQFIENALPSLRMPIVPSECCLSNTSPCKDNLDAYSDAVFDTARKLEMEVFCNIMHCRYIDEWTRTTGCTPDSQIYSGLIQFRQTNSNCNVDYQFMCVDFLGIVILLCPQIVLVQNAPYLPFEQIMNAIGNPEFPEVVQNGYGDIFKLYWFNDDLQKLDNLWCRNAQPDTLPDSWFHDNPGVAIELFAIELLLTASMVGWACWECLKQTRFFQNILRNPNNA